MYELASYRRRLSVSLERMFENALDWEHLPYLHKSSFAELKLLEEGVEDGRPYWRAALRLQPAALRLRQVVQLTLDRGEGVWITEVLEGVSRGLRVHTRARAWGPRSIEVHVRFLMPTPTRRARWSAPLLRRVLGPIYVATYRRLYDEDERMMVTRQAQLDRSRGSARLLEPRRLGPRSEVLRKGYRLRVGRHEFRVVQVRGELVAFSTLCPHLLGPLDDAEVHDGQVRCPWHDYCFDVRTGEAVGRRLRLTPAPRLEERDGVVWAVG